MHFRAGPIMGPGGTMGPERHFQGGGKLMPKSSGRAAAHQPACSTRSATYPAVREPSAVAVSSDRSGRAEHSLPRGEKSVGEWAGWRVSERTG